MLRYIALAAGIMFSQVLSRPNGVINDLAKRAEIRKKIANKPITIHECIHPTIPRPKISEPEQASGIAGFFAGLGFTSSTAETKQPPVNEGQVGTFVRTCSITANEAVLDCMREYDSLGESGGGGAAQDLRWSRVVPGPMEYTPEVNFFIGFQSDFQNGISEKEVPDQYVMYEMPLAADLTYRIRDWVPNYAVQGDFSNAIRANISCYAPSGYARFSLNLDRTKEPGVLAVVNPFIHKFVRKLFDVPDLNHAPMDPFYGWAESTNFSVPLYNLPKIVDGLIKMASLGISVEVKSSKIFMGTEWKSFTAKFSNQNGVFAELTIDLAVGVADSGNAEYTKALEQINAINSADPQKQVSALVDAVLAMIQVEFQGLVKAKRQAMGLPG